MAETNASAVREAAALIFAAEDLLDLGASDDLDRIAAAVTQIARSGKALRANHLDDALAHVAARAEWVAQERRRWEPQMKSAPADPWGLADTVVDDTRDRDARREAAVDTLVGTPDVADVAALRDRVRGDDG